MFAKFGMSYGEWTVFLACNAANGMNARDQMEGLKAYFNEHPGIAGLMLSNLVVDISIGFNIIKIFFWV